ncbi:MAG: ATP-binding protein [Treponema sp.]|jgi:AAA+ ATPase superfamily predicted ATPase|nr:ATP-binding protein [Treponema sp.]
MFVGREKELAELERLYSTKTYQFVILYGRRRVGKSTLINQFIQNKQAVYFTAVESDSRRNLELFSGILMKLRGIESEAMFSSWEKAFDEAALLSKKRLVLIIDEYPYLAQAEKSISSILQHYCDTVFKKIPIMIILCGSSMSFMENQVLGYQSPLYGRRTAQMKIEPFGYGEAAAFVPKYTLEQKALVYGISGGIPKYLELINDSLSIKNNIIKNYLIITGYLYEEPVNLLKQELREPAKYNMIIEAIAKGATRMNDISTKTGLDSSAVSNYINSLISLGILRKESAVTEEKNKRKTLYRLADTMFIFWYRYVFGNEFSIVTGDAESLYDNEIEVNLNHFMGPVFEKMCAEYLGRLNAIHQGKVLPFKIRQLGRWWGSNPVTKTEEEIDLLGVNEKLSSALFCECKYRNQPTDLSVLNDLLAKAERWQEYKHKYFMLFSKSRFSKEVQTMAKKRGDVQLVRLEEMY